MRCRRRHRPGEGRPNRASRMGHRQVAAPEPEPTGGPDPHGRPQPERVNPLSWNRSGLVRFQVDDGASLTNLATGQPVTYEVVAEKDGTQTIRFWAAGVPPLGYKSY